LSFPANLIPFSSVAYVTAANAAGQQLVVGNLTGGANILTQLPPPDSNDEFYCDSAVQLASGQFYSNVFVPSLQERAGNFRAFAGLLVDPANNQPFPGGVIPGNRLGAVYAFRIGAAQPNQAVRGWNFTGSTTIAYVFNPAVLLPTGKVFIVNNVAQVYDPATGIFTPVGKTLVDHGNFFSGVLLNDGRVLLIGGQNSPSAAELFDSSTGKFTVLPSTLEPHGVWQTLTLLTDGRVLIVGGMAGVGFDGSLTAPNGGAEIFDPKTLTFKKTQPMMANRRRHTATLLQDGRVLITGGALNGDYATNAVEIFDPSTGTFSSTTPMPFDRSNHFAALLPNGKVLVGAGYGGGDSTANLYNAKTAIWESTGNLTVPREEVVATLLTSGQVLVIGGYSNNPNITNATELFNLDTGAFTPSASMNTARKGNSATLLNDGRVLVVGGSPTPSTAVASAEIYTPTVQGLTTSQTGLTFRSAQGSRAVPSQSLAVLSTADDIPWTVSVKTYSGENWLAASPPTSRSTPGAPLVSLTVNVDPTGLTPQDYYGAVTITPTDQKHPAVTIAVVFTIVPTGTAAPLQIAPTGLVFLGTAGASPNPQQFTVTNFTSRAVNFTATSSGTWFTFTPSSGTTTAVIPGKITVTPTSDTLAAGVYRGSIKLSFSDGSSQVVDLLLVIVSALKSSNAQARDAAATCVASKLLPVVTSIASGFSAPAAWPTPVIVQVVDDCGTAVNSGTVTASFTTGDASIPLIAIGNGIWSATWVPVRTSQGASLRVDAQTSTTLTGTVQVSLQVLLNPKVPVVASGGVLSSGDYTGSPAQGLLVSVFGSSLADGMLSNTSLPLPSQLGSTNVIVSGVLLPVLYVSENQVNVLIPFELTANTSQQLILRRGNAGSVPIAITILDSQPAILSTTGTGAGQGQIYKIASNSQSLADGASPAQAGDTLVIYTVGLGPVSPPLKSGDPAPLTYLEPIQGNASVLIGGVSAPVAFAGLTPGFAGLYQINVQVPRGITPDTRVPVSVLINGRASSGNIFMAIK